MTVGAHARSGGQVPVVVDMAEPPTTRVLNLGPGPGRRTEPRRTRATPVHDSRLRALDGLRLLCALAVALFHFLAIEEAAQAWGKDGERIFPDADAIAPYGWLGVEVFFMISGFAICMSCWGRTLGRV